MAQAIQLKLAHCSMEFKDTDEEQLSDAKRLFHRASATGTAWMTGTEAGPASNLSDILQEQAWAHGYRFFRPKETDCWIAIEADMVDGSYEEYWKQVLPKTTGVGRAGPKGIVSVEFMNRNIGKVTVIAAHYLTKGRPDTNSKLYSTNVKKNKKLAQAIGQYTRDQGRGKALVFLGADTNIVDRTSDTFFGEPLTSSWDEIGKWENTGAGNIDVIASYDLDGRVSAVSSRALSDKEFPLNTNHFLVEAVFNVVPVGAGRGRN